MAGGLGDKGSLRSVHYSRFPSFQFVSFFYYYHFVIGMWNLASLDLGIWYRGWVGGSGTRRRITWKEVHGDGFGIGCLFLFEAIYLVVPMQVIKNNLVI